MDQAPDDKLEQARKSDVSAVLSFVIGLLVVVGGALVAFVLFTNRDKPETVVEDRPAPTVDAIPLVISDHVVEISTQGVVESRREVKLAAQISGSVEKISPNFEDGAHVEVNDELVTIEKADYEASLARANAAKEEAELALKIEKAKGKQAEIDWQKLGQGKATDLALRLPQIKSAEKKRDSAKQEVERANRDLERTVISSPFSGRIRSTQIEVGSFLSPGLVIAEIYSDQDLEVRLPFPLVDFGFLRGEGTPPFEVTATVGGEKLSWPAELIRVDGEVDRATLSGYATAEIKADESGHYPPVGLFVEATLKGKVLKGVFEVPRSAVRRSNEVWVAVKKDDIRVLDKRTVDVLRSDRTHHIVRGEFDDDDMLVTTRLQTAAIGDEVKVAGEGEESE